MRCLVAAVVLLGLGIGDSIAADAPPPPAQPIGVGQLLVVNPRSGAVVRLNLARYHVKVELQPPVALVQIDQSFFNPHPTRQEGTFVFNLPDGAAVSRFAMFASPTRLIEGELIDLARVPTIYQTIGSQRDPELLDQIGNNLFRMRVFPIPAHDTKRILLDYTVPLIENNEGRYSFELPLMSDLAPIGDFAITGEIHGPTVAETAASKSYPDTKFSGPEEGILRFELRKTAFRAAAPFAVQFQQRPAEEATVRNYVPEAVAAAPPKQAAPKQAAPKKVDEKAEPAQPLCDFLATISPDVLNKNGPPGDAPATPVDVLILADTSAANVHRQALRKTVRSIADSLRKTDRFQLGCVDTAFRPLGKDWIVSQSADAEKALASFDREFFMGAVDFEASFKTACESLPAAAPGRRRWIIYVGDGTLPRGNATPIEIHTRLAPSLGEMLRFGAVLLSRDAAGGLLMERLAATAGGRVFRIGRSGALTEALAWTAAGCAEPVKIVEVKAEGVAHDDLFVPVSWIPGTALHIFGRRKTAEPFKLTLTIERAGGREPFEWTLAADPDPDDLFVGRLWAQRKIDLLRALETTDPKAANTRDQQLALSQEWTLLNDATAFLVLNEEADYAKYGVQRSLRHTYWNPDADMAAVPLPPALVKSLDQNPPKSTELTADEFAAALAASRAALKNSAPNQALKSLQGVEKSPLAKTTPEFAALRDAAKQLLARAELLAALGPQRGWFDRTRAIGFPTGTSDLVWQFVYGYGPSRAHDGPRPSVLFKRVAPPSPEMTLVDFTNWVRETSGLNVLLDEANIVDEGISLDQAVDLRGVHSMPLQDLLENVLTPLLMTSQSEDGSLKLTTRTNAGERLETRLYPVRDLVLSTEPTDMSLLGDADLDGSLLSMRRLEKHLDQKMSVDFEELPLEEALEFVRQGIEDNLLLDRQTLTDEGVALDEPVSLQLKDMPVRRILKELLEPRQLTMIVDNDAIKITSSSHVGEKLHTRIHAAQGLVHVVPHELQQTLPPPRQTSTFRGPVEPGLPGKAAGARGVDLGMGGATGFGSPNGNLGQATPIAGFSESLEPGGDAQSADGPRYSRSSRQSSDGINDWLDVAQESQANDSKLGVTPATKTDSAEMISTTTATVEPDSWEDLSGPGSIVYAPGAHSFLVRQTEAVQNELADFFQQMRALPLAFGEQAGRQLATPQLVGANDVANWDTRQLVKLLSASVQPESWEDVAGPGSMRIQTSKLVLVVRQTADIHREVRSLLSAMRRARYLARRGVIWNSFDVVTGPEFPVALGVTEFPSALVPGNSGKADLPAAEPGELKALEVLAESVAGVQTWRSIPAAGNGNAMIVRQTAQRSEFEFDGRIARIAGTEAAIAYPGLTLVERGAWGPELRKIMDGRLPWLPHRTRRELAELFTVKVIAQNDQTTQLQLALPLGARGDEIVVTVARKTGLPTLWESRLAGQPVLRLRFEELRQAKGKPIWSKVSAEDGAGRQIERWELASFTELKTEIPPLDEFWPNFAQLDVREQEPAEPRPFVKALQALRGSDWEAVDRAFAAALAKQPRQPLVSFLKAWNLAQRPKNEADVVALLTDVARGGAADLIRNIAEGAFLHLSAKEMYAVLLAVPDKQRDPAIWDHLARMAARSGQTDAAIQHVKSAIAAAGPAGDSPERSASLVKLLLETNQIAAAFQLAQSRVKRSDIADEDIPALVDLFSRASAAPEAQKLIAAALAHPGAAGPTRQKFLACRAGLESGGSRCRTLIEAASLLPADSSERATVIRQLTRELTKAGESGKAGLLAKQTQDAEIAAALWLIQADEEVQQTNLAAAADIGWKLHEAQQLPSGRFDWFVDRLHAAGQHERVISILEDRLRAGERVATKVVHSILSAAYDAVGRKDEANRARSDTGPPQPPARPTVGGGMM